MNTQSIRDSERAALLRQFVNAVRECLQKDPLYDMGNPKHSQRTEAERFYVPAMRWPGEQRR